LSDILKKILAKLYAWALPTTLAIGFYYLFVHPKTAFGHGLVGRISDTWQAGIMIAVIATITITLNAFSTSLYWILAGYIIWPEWLQEWGVRRQRARKARLLRASRSRPHGRLKTRDAWRRGLVYERLRLYPTNSRQIAPTRFGNAIRSFETYGKTRYFLDSDSLWSELCAASPKYLQAELAEVRSSVDFFVASIYLNLFLGVVILSIACFEGKFSLYVFGLIALVASAFWHWLAVRATREWSFIHCAIVNVGRVKLAESLGLELPPSLEQERDMWGLVTHYAYFRTRKEGNELNKYRKRL
jgi:hypothetical protein